MKIIKKGRSDLLSDKLDMCERGVLACLICVEDPGGQKVTAAKFKAQFTLSQSNKNILASLHEKGFIEWSGYAKHKESREPFQNEKDLIEIYGFMNDTLGGFRKITAGKGKGYTSAAKAAVARIKDGYTVEDFKLVIANRYELWKDDAKMSPYLRPATLFAKSNFEKYYEEAKNTRKGAGRVEAEAINLTEGEILTTGRCKNLPDKDSFKVLRCTVDMTTGKVKNIGSTRETLIGEVIKRNLKLQDNARRRGSFPPFVYKWTKQD